MKIENVVAAMAVVASLTACAQDITYGGIVDVRPEGNLTGPTALNNRAEEAGDSALGSLLYGSEEEYRGAWGEEFHRLGISAYVPFIDENGRYHPSRLPDWATKRDTAYVFNLHEGRTGQYYVRHVTLRDAQGTPYSQMEGTYFQHGNNAGSRTAHGVFFDERDALAGLSGTISYDLGVTANGVAEEGMPVATGITHTSSGRFSVLDEVWETDTAELILNLDNIGDSSLRIEKPRGEHSPAETLWFGGFELDEHSRDGSSETAYTLSANGHQHGVPTNIEASEAGGVWFGSFSRNGFIEQNSRGRIIGEVRSHHGVFAIGRQE